MKIFRVLPVLLFVVLAAPAGFSQRPVSPQSPAALSSPARNILTDSLALLDSLVQFNRVRNNDLSVKLAGRAIRIAQKLDTPEALATAWNLMGIAYSVNAKDSSYLFYSKALRIADSSHLTHQKVHILFHVAMVCFFAQNYQGALILLDSCINLSESDHNLSVVAYAYNSIGDIQSAMNNNELAIKYYRKSFEMAQKYNNFKQMGIALGSLSKLDTNTNSAIRDQRTALSYLSKSIGTEEEQARVFVNIGNRFVNSDSALMNYHLALKCVGSTHLPEITISAYNNMVYAYLDKGMISRAEECITLHALPLALQTHDFDWLSTIYDTYADVLVSKGELKEAVGYQKRALEARILADQKLAGGQLRLLAALLDVKNKELDLRKREGELMAEKSRSQSLKLWLVAASLVAGSVLFLLVWVRQRGRLKLRMIQIGSAKKIIGMQENEKTAVARELHDLTGQLVAGIAGEISSLDVAEPVRTEIAERVREVGGRMRRISHRMRQAMPEHFSFAELIGELCEDTERFTELKIHLELEEPLRRIPAEVVHHWYRIVQELLTNASKHVVRGDVFLTFITGEQRILLRYSDNGPGFDPASLTGNTMGLNNISERAGFLGGYARVSSAPGKGVSWEISIPVEMEKKVN